MLVNERRSGLFLPQVWEQISKKEDFKSIEQEIMIDTIGYLSNTQDYDKIIIFIYDNSGSVQEHGTTKRDLIKIKEIEDVIIVSKPSQLP